MTPTVSIWNAQKNQKNTRKSNLEARHSRYAPIGKEKEREPMKTEPRKMRGKVDTIPKVRAFLAAVILLTTTGTALPHHSFAIFDHTRTYTLKGTVAEWTWTNPHGYIELDLTEGPEGMEHFTLELTSINMLRRAGWRSSDIAAGDAVTVITAPLINGDPGGLLLEIHLPDGRTLAPPVPAIDTFQRTP